MPALTLFLFIMFLNGCTGKTNYCCDSTTKKNEPSPNSILKVKNNGKTIGTAFYFSIEKGDNEYNLLISAAHVFSDLNNDTENFTVSDKDETFSANIFTYKIISDLDICIIFLKDKKPLTNTRPLYSQQEIDFPETGNIFSFNYSIFEPKIRGVLLYSRGYIVDLNNDESILLYMDVINRGASGAPIVFTDTGKVIGVVTKQVVDFNSDLPTGLTYAVPISTINKGIIDYLDNSSNIN